MSSRLFHGYIYIQWNEMDRLPGREQKKKLILHDQGMSTAPRTGALLIVLPASLLWQAATFPGILR